MASRKPLVLGPAKGAQELAVGDLLVVGTAAVNDNSTAAASTAFVAASYAPTANPVFTGSMGLPSVTTRLGTASTQSFTKVTSAATDQTLSDVYTVPGSISYRLVNDANSAANPYLVVYRTGYSVTQLTLTASAIGLVGNTTVTGNSIVTGSMTVSGALTGNWNMNAVPSGGTSGSYTLGWNMSAGGGEIAFLNNYQTAIAAYTWNLRTGTTTADRLMKLNPDGTLYLGTGQVQVATQAYTTAALGSCTYLNGALIVGIAGSLPRTDIYTVANAAGWTKDTRATLIQGSVIGGGAGAGAGVVAVASTACSGGAGGGAGYTLDFFALASDFPATIASSAIVVGAAGASGSGSGVSGTSGGTSKLGSLFAAVGGAFGVGGISNASAPGGTGGGLQGLGSLNGGGAPNAAATYTGGGTGGGTGLTGAVGYNAPLMLVRGAQGGAAGGGISSAGAAFAGGATSGSWALPVPLVTQVAAASANANAPAQLAPAVAYGPGAGGLGGGSAATGTGGNGGVGAGYGAGGGGGGSAASGLTPGSGGAGTPGLIIITQR